MNFPRELVEAVRRHQVVPFVGAGISMGVKRGMFPSWPRLLEGLAERMQEESLPESAIQEVNQRIAQGDYLTAAELAFKDLGAYRFNRFLRERFRVRKPSDADLSVIHALWKLQPPVVMTPNYDDVLLWGREDAEAVSNDQDDELNLMDAEASPGTPRVWYLHGTVHRLSTLVLAGADYKRLYGDGSQPTGYSQYTNALVRLREWIRSKPFLYMGFSFSDPYVLKQLEHVIGITRGRQMPSFALMKKGTLDRGALWPKYNIQLVEYEDHGAPLAEFLRGLGEAAFGPSRVSLSMETEALSFGIAPAPPQSMSPAIPGPAPVAPTPEALPIVARPALEQEYTRILQGQHRLVLLSPEDGGTRALARRVAARYGNRVTWLAPPNVPDCTEAEYCRALAGDDAGANTVTSFDALVEHLRAKATRLGREHLIILRYEWGPFDHLTALGRHLRRMMDEPSKVQFHFLIAGGERSAWLLHNMQSFSVFKDAPRREVPDLTVEEVRQFLGSGGHAGARWARELHEATGGHPGLLREVMTTDGALDAASITGKLVRGPSLRGAVLECLREDERNGYTGERGCHSVLTKLLDGQRVEDLEPLDHRVEYPEVRLYFAGLVRSDAAGRTVPRCKAVEQVAREVLARKDVRP
ncbi:SIR2 family protein [Corallococcus sp. bb12-1]|uniref:SIR2 family protein n=1 Tax=Corallococcus sp. bb12-1 TaxID=2996784 RepID=UPI00226E1A15|nr:SIR2 family protein [Corallococcus sp. bb12-1]MCY1045634.1 SIR2 family protein [Corallococcus sp. bb12-1]